LTTRWRSLLGVLLLAGLAAQLLHRSGGSTRLAGRYSPGYLGLLCLSCLGALALWLAIRPGSAAWARLRLLYGLPPFRVALAAALLGTVLLALGAGMVSWLLAARLITGAWAALALVVGGAALLLAPSRLPGFAEASARLALLAAASLGALLGCELLARRVWTPPLAFHRNAHPELYGLNSWGLRDREHAARKPPGVVRLAGLGDSVTFGWAVSREQGFLAQMQRRLDARGAPRFEVINLSKPGINTVQQLDLLRRVGLRFRPDVVLLVFVVNDPEPSGTNFNLVPAGPPPGWRRLAQRIWLGLLVESALHRSRPRAAASYEEYVRRIFDPGSEGWKACAGALGGLRDLGRAHGFRPAVALFPVPVPFSRYPFREQHAQVMRTCRELGLPALDLLDEFEAAGLGGPELDVGDGHPNALGHRRMAEALLRFLDRIGYLGPAPGSAG
jgi:lysophospholipase L1-like esterase